ncbi:HD domain-containing protein [Deinococcus pimensis]|uniref:HD domain-containing protein n=1 Tax=Deinococcus pimensis TaxID=309888 RepID=UPI0004833E32|nr:HD domain-containing protein [Deinococcus pimensis]
MLTDHLTRQFAFVTEIDRLKSVLRQTDLIDGSRRENTAEHSWHVCVLAMALHEHAEAPRPDLDRVLRMLLLHDVVEIDAGDTFAYDTVGYEDKAEREAAAARRLFGLLPVEQGTAWRALWEEFEAGVTPEARFANAVDRLLPVVQNFAAGGGSWTRHGVARSQVLRRVEPVRDVSGTLWAYVAALLDRAVERGFLGDA